jgi:uncharacterized protein YceK
MKLRAIVIALAAAVVLSGCSSSTGPDEGTPSSQYPERTSPDNLIAKFTQAYVNMDLEACLDCLATDFTFRPGEDDIMNPDHPLPLFWDRAVEVAIDDSMFSSDSYVDSIRVDLTPESISFDPGSDPDDPADNLWTYREATDFRLFVHNPPDLVYHTIHDQIFTIRIDPDRTGAGGDTLWEIAAWEEDSPPGERGRREDGSWARYKYMFYEPAPTECPARTSPTNVLTKLRDAYVSRDALAYLDCLASDFTFHVSPMDIEDPDNPLPESWGKAAEVVMHQHMFSEGSGILNIALALTYLSDSYDAGADPEDPMDDRWTYTEGARLSVRVEDPPDLTYFTTADQLFVFQVDPDEVGPAGETLWEIVDWFDLAEAPGARVEPSSWGKIKTMYW